MGNSNISKLVGTRNPTVYTIHCNLLHINLCEERSINKSRHGSVTFLRNSHSLLGKHGKQKNANVKSHFTPICKLLENTLCFTTLVYSFLMRCDFTFTLSPKCVTKRRLLDEM